MRLAQGPATGEGKTFPVPGRPGKSFRVRRARQGLPDHRRIAPASRFTLPSADLLACGRFAGSDARYGMWLARDVLVTRPCIRIGGCVLEISMSKPCGPCAPTHRSRLDMGRTLTRKVMPVASVEASGIEDWGIEELK